MFKMPGTFEVTLINIFIITATCFYVKKKAVISCAVLSEPHGHVFIFQLIVWVLWSTAVCHIDFMFCVMVIILFFVFKKNFAFGNPKYSFLHKEFYTGLWVYTGLYFVFIFLQSVVLLFMSFTVRLLTVVSVKHFGQLMLFLNVL